MAQNMSNFDEALKEDYLPGVREQLNNTNMLLSQVQKNTEDIEGRRAILSLHLGRSGGYGARADGGTLPTAGNQEFAEQRIPVKHLYGTIKVTGPVMRASKSDKGSFVRALDAEMKGLVNDVKRDTNRQLFGTSDGKVATCGTTSSSTTVTLASTTTATEMRQIHVGMVVDIGTVAAPTGVASARTVTSVNRSAKTFVISGAAVSTSDGTDFIFVAGAGGADGGVGQKELTGLRTIIDSSGTVFNVNPSTYPDWASYESTAASNRTFTENLAATAANEVVIASGKEANLWITSYGVHRSFANQLQAAKRFSNTLDLKGGFEGLEVAAGAAPVALVADRDCPENTAFLVNTDHLILFEQSDWEWADDDGAVLSRTSGEDAWEAFLYKDCEFATDQRNAHAKVANLTEA